MARKMLKGSDDVKMKDLEKSNTQTPRSSARALMVNLHELTELPLVSLKDISNILESTKHKMSDKCAHVVFTINLVIKGRNACAASMTFVDLAGTERPLLSDPRMEEKVNVNFSLAALEKVLLSLREKDENVP